MNPPGLSDLRGASPPSLPSCFYRLGAEILRIHRLLTPLDFRKWLGCLARTWNQVLRERSLGPVDRAFPQAFRIRFAEQPLFFEGTCFSLVREIFGNSCYATPAELRQERNILDLGANTGVFSVFALASSPACRVHAVEAQPTMLPLLRKNISQNGFGERFQAEAAVVAGGWDAWTRELMDRNAGLPAFDPDAFFHTHGECGFCKCDVEGAEFELLRSEPAWLRRIRRLVLEYHGTWAEGKKLREILRQSGFRVTQTGHGSLGYLKAVRP